jgi:glutaredoxin-like protein
LLFTPEDKIEIKKRLEEVENTVKLILFSQSLNCESCPETETLLKELAALSDKLTLEVLNLHLDREKVDQYKVTLAPTLILEGDRDYGIRFMGMPAGYEFASLLEDIISVGKRSSGLSEASREKVRAVTEPLNLKVFVTPG